MLPLLNSRWWLPLLFTLLFGITEMSRILFYWNTAAEVHPAGCKAGSGLQ